MTLFWLLPAIPALCVVNFTEQMFVFALELLQAESSSHNTAPFSSSISALLLWGHCCLHLHLSPWAQGGTAGLTRAALPGLLNECFLLSHRYPHNVVNHLSCDEAKNHFGGVVSLIPIVLDGVKEWLSHIEKLPRHMVCNVSDTSAEKRAPQDAASRAAISPQTPSVHPEAQTSVSNKDCVQVQGNKRVRKKHMTDRENHCGKLKGPWKPPGRHAF